jgi:hypothetical protein
MSKKSSAPEPTATPDHGAGFKSGFTPDIEGQPTHPMLTDTSDYSLPSVRKSPVRSGNQK